MSSNTIDLACTYLEIDVGSYLKENRPYMTTEQLKTLCRDGFKLGAHSITHRYFRSTGLEIIENEAVRSCDFVKVFPARKRFPLRFRSTRTTVADDFLDGLSNKSEPWAGCMEAAASPTPSGPYTTVFWPMSRRVIPRARHSGAY